MPDLSSASAAAFDQYELIEQIGYDTAMAAKDDILALASGYPTPDMTKDII